MRLVKSLLFLIALSFVGQSVHADVTQESTAVVPDIQTTNAEMEKGFTQLEKMVDEMESTRQYADAYLYAHQLNNKMLRTIRDSASAKNAIQWMGRFEKLGQKFAVKGEKIAVADKDKIDAATRQHIEELRPLILKEKMETSRLIEWLGSKAYYGSRALAEKIGGTEADVY